MSTTKKIGILTSGGDCAGLNAVIRAVVNSASRLGWEVYGIKNGTPAIPTVMPGESITEECATMLAQSGILEIQVVK